MAGPPRDILETRDLFQVRVTPVLRWPFNGMPVHYDSIHVFLNTRDAELYKPSFIKALLEEGFIVEPKPARPPKVAKITYEVEVIPLSLVIREDSLK